MFALTTGITPIISGGTHNVKTEKDVYCFNFDGVDEYVDTTITGNELMVNNEFTIAAWVRLADGDDSGHICGASDGQNKIFLSFASGWGVFYVSSDSGDDSLAVYDDTTLSDGDSGWLFIAGKLDSNLGYVSVNGSTWDNASDNGFLHNEFSSTKNIWLGASNIDDSYGIGRSGKISSIMFFAKAFSQLELAELYNGGDSLDPREIPSSNLLAYYSMGDQSSDTLGILAEDDCANNDTSDWTLSHDDGTVSLTHSSDRYRLSTGASSFRYAYLDDLQVYAGKIYRFDAKIKNGTELGYTLNLSLIFDDDGDNVSTGFDTDGTMTLRTIYATSSTTQKVQARLFCLAPMGGDYVEIQDVKVGQAVEDGGAFITDTLVDVSVNNNTGTPVNMENADIVEDSP